MDDKTMHIDGNVEKEYQDGKVLYESNLDKITIKVNEIVSSINNADPWMNFIV